MYPFAEPALTRASHDGHAAVKCNVKAHEGQLYFLEKQLLFLSKQPTLVLHAQIHSVTFARVGGALPSARTFDLHVKLSSSAAGESIVFSSLNKEELESIEEFLRMKKVRVKNEMEEYNVVLGAVDEDMGGMSDSGIGGMVAGGPGDEEDEDSEGAPLIPRPVQTTDDAYQSTRTSRLRLNPTRADRAVTLATRAATRGTRWTRAATRMRQRRRRLDWISDVKYYRLSLPCTRSSSSSCCLRGLRWSEKRVVKEMFDDRSSPRAHVRLDSPAHAVEHKAECGGSRGAGRGAEGGRRRGCSASRVRVWRPTGRDSDDGVLPGALLLPLRVPLLLRRCAPRADSPLTVFAGQFARPANVLALHGQGGWLEFLATVGALIRDVRPESPLRV